LSVGDALGAFFVDSILEGGGESVLLGVPADAILLDEVGE
jgi:hypothetical protein